MIIQNLPSHRTPRAYLSSRMTGAAIARWEAQGSVVLAVHGAFDGASAWTLRVTMEDSAARDFVIDLTHAVEAFDFAAALVAAWARERRREKRVRFRPGSPDHARMLAAHGLELAAATDDALPLFPPAAGSGAAA